MTQTTQKINPSLFLDCLSESRTNIPGTYVLFSELIDSGLQQCHLSSETKASASLSPKNRSLQSCMSSTEAISQRAN